MSRIRSMEMYGFTNVGAPRPTSGPVETRSHALSLDDDVAPLANEMLPRLDRVVGVSTSVPTAPRAPLPHLSRSDLPRLLRSAARELASSLDAIETRRLHEIVERQVTLCDELFARTPNRF